MWNSLPATIDLRQITSYGQFRQHLKTHLFKAYTSQCIGTLDYCALYKYSYLLTYLLTAKPIEVKWGQGTTHLVRPGTSPKEGAISQSIVSVGIIRRAVDILNDFQ